MSRRPASSSGHGCTASRMSSRFILSMISLMGSRLLRSCRLTIRKCTDARKVDWISSSSLRHAFSLPGRG